MCGLLLYEMFAVDVRKILLGAVELRGGQDLLFDRSSARSSRWKNEVQGGEVF
jgi:hypothetical protein